MDIKEALLAVINESNQPYAIPYAAAALKEGHSKNATLLQTDRLPCALFVLRDKTGQMMDGLELKIQLLYVLNNLACWRGERAREVKAVLKAASKDKRPKRR